MSIPAMHGQVGAGMHGHWAESSFTQPLWCVPYDRFGEGYCRLGGSSWATEQKLLPPPFPSSAMERASGSLVAVPSPFLLLLLPTIKVPSKYEGAWCGIMWIPRGTRFTYDYMRQMLQVHVPRRCESPPVPPEVSHGAPLEVETDGSYCSGRHAVPEQVLEARRIVLEVHGGQLEGGGGGEGGGEGALPAAPAGAGGGRWDAAETADGVSAAAKQPEAAAEDVLAVAVCEERRGRRGGGTCATCPATSGGSGSGNDHDAGLEGPARCQDCQACKMLPRACARLKCKMSEGVLSG